MHTQTQTSAARTRPRRHRRNLFNTPRILSASAAQPCGLTQAQLREIVLEQLG